MELPRATHLACLLGVILAISLHPAASENCTMIEGQPACVCNTSKGKIDLTPLSNNVTARFVGILDPNQYIYSYNPCHQVTIGECKDSFICQRSTSDPQEHSIANHGEKIEGNNNGSFYVTYKTNNDIVKGTQVSLICEQGKGIEHSRVVSLGDTETFFYKFELYSCQACPGGCKETAASIVGYIGLVIIILLIVGVIIYFIVGAVIRKVRYQATGSDIIPNKGFWMELPLLVKDGCLFVTSPCCRNRDGYSKM